MEHSKEDESPSDLSEDGPPALLNAVSKIYEEERNGHTDIIHGAMIWNVVVSQASATGPGTGVLTTASTMNAAW